MVRVTSWLAIGLSVLAAAPLGAQILTGNIIGTVKDESGAVLPGVTVTLSSPALPAGPASVVTAANGGYRFTELAPGSYSVNVSLVGFSNYQEEGLRVNAGSTVERIVTLKLATVAESITVSGESPMVDPRRVGVSATVDKLAIDTLPIHRYYAVEVAKWTPGVAASDPAGSGAGLSVMGSATSENSIVFDGVIAQNPQSGNPWSSGDIDAIEEIQVVTLGASAEYQVAQGGVFNMVFKQGTNAFKFDASGYWFPDQLVSKPIERPCNCPLGQTGYEILLWRNYSGHAGGPIVKDKVWFYAGGNYDGKRISTPGLNSTLPAKRLFYSHAAFSKVTWQINDNLKFKQMYAHDWWGGQVIPTVQRPVETLAANFGLVRTYASEVNYTLSNRTLLTARATGWFDPEYPFKPLNDDRVTSFRTDQLTGLACCGVQNFGSNDLSRHGQAVKVNHYIQGGRMSHDVRLGVQLEQASSVLKRALPSGVNFSDLGGRPDQATFRDPYTSGAKYHEFGVWGEDQVTLGGRLTLNLGARFDHMIAISPDLPAVDLQLKETGSTVSGLGDMFTWNSVAPRLGFNYKLTADNKMVLRGNYGRAYRTIFLNDFESVHPGLSPIALARWNPASSSYSTIISVTNPTANIGVDKEMDAPFTDAASLGLDRELAPNLGFGVTYVYKYGQKQVGWKDVGGVYGTRLETLPDGRTVIVLPLLNSASARRFVRTNGPGTFNRYHGLVLVLEKRWSRRWQGSFSYTFSKAEGLQTTAQDPNGDINAAGRLATDRPNVLVASTTFEVPKALVQISVNFLEAQGAPYAPQALVSLPQGRLPVNIAPPDGTYRFPNQDLLNFRVSKILFRSAGRRVELAAELMNALQDTAFDTVLTQNFFSPTFGQSANWIPPRRMNFLARVDF